MAGFTERSTIQQALLTWAEQSGWAYMPGDQVPREDHNAVIVREWVHEALLANNPDLAQPGSDEEIEGLFIDLDRAILDASNGLVAANEKLTKILRGQQDFKVPGGKPTPRAFLNFDDPHANRLVVSDEVVIGPPGSKRRFDVVYWVNGFPLAVIETKTPMQKSKSWFNGAKELYEIYQAEYPQFFAPNILMAASEFKDFRFGAVGQHPTSWQVWGSTDSDARLTGPKRVELSAKLLLTPEMLLSILRDFTLFKHARGAGERDIKLLPRYPQVEAALAIHDKVLSGKPGGLIWHHQGSGKTLLTEFASLMLLNDSRVDSPTVILLMDRTQLVGQAAETLRSTGLRVERPKSSAALRRLLADDTRGIIITTIHKFADAGFLNNRDNIVVMVDEAHRTQEGRLGQAVRDAVPNARFFGMTGTPIADSDRNTFRLFGDPADPDFIMSRYSPTRSLIDGTTVPIVVESRLVDFHIDEGALEEEYKSLAAQEGLSDDEVEFLASKVSQTSTILSNPERVRAVCVDIVDHYLAKVAPLGLKAQVVAYNRDLVVAYTDGIRAELAKRGSDLEVALDISVSESKDERREFKKYRMTEEQEEGLKRRFTNPTDPLSFIVVTAKLMTGFDAPNEGVLYLDKPLKAHTLFQTITRPNRVWTNPVTGKRKKFGLVVDYIGLARAIGKAMVDPTASDADGDDKALPPGDVNELAGRFVTGLMTLLGMLDNPDVKNDSFEAFSRAYETATATRDARKEFAEQFVALETLWEFLFPHPALMPFMDQYKWLAKMYQAVTPSNVSHELLWERLGVKTLNLIHSNISDVTINSDPTRVVTLNAAGIELVRKIASLVANRSSSGEERLNQDMTLDDVLDTIERRLEQLGRDKDDATYKSLAARIAALREASIRNAEDSLKFLREAFEIAQDVVAADRREKSGTFVEPKKGALTQIIEESRPEGLSVVVADVADAIDEVVSRVSYTGWNATSKGDRIVKRELRLILNRFNLPADGDLFDKAYAYVRENY
ncbi:HsdR family type I site-specific deoxyribonuclease [Streptomyces sp. NPDC049099]|uniref:type I restriction endonuclease subunit R n=1 Tax=Streptomyces sp. NPDC049099 TaxID=3155768 RepID=UPI003427A4A5